MQFRSFVVFQIRKAAVPKLQQVLFEDTIVGDDILFMNLAATWVYLAEKCLGCFDFQIPNHLIFKMRPGNYLSVFSPWNQPAVLGDPKPKD